MENLKQQLINEAKRIEEDGLYSAKRHFVTASFWTNLHLWIGIPAAILSAIAGVSAFSQFKNHNLIAGIFALIVSALTAVTTFLDPNGKANAHLNAGNAYNALRNRARIFSEISCNANQTDELISQLAELTSQRDELNQNSPITPKWAFNKARRGIEEGEAQYQIDNQKKRPRAARRSSTNH